MSHIFTVFPPAISTFQAPLLTCSSRYSVHLPNNKAAFTAADRRLMSEECCSLTGIHTHAHTELIITTLIIVITPKMS